MITGVELRHYIFVLMCWFVAVAWFLLIIANNWAVFLHFAFCLQINVSIHPYTYTYLK